MRYVSAVFAVCCVAVILVVLVSVRPVAGQGPEMGTARRHLDALSSMVSATRFHVLPTSVRWETWNPAAAPYHLVGSWGADPRTRREVQLVSGQTVRSKTRTAIGGVLFAVGGLAAYYAYFLCAVGGADASLYTGKYSLDYNGCVLDPYPSWRHDVFTEHAPDYRFVAGGAGAMALGLLLTTVWSDVEVRRSQSGVEVSKRISISGKQR